MGFSIDLHRRPYNTVAPVRVCDLLLNPQHRFGNESVLVHSSRLVKARFIATLLNSTRHRVELSCVAINGPLKGKYNKGMVELCVLQDDTALMILFHNYSS